MKLGENKVAVALSGGVDSAVTAYLLKQKGYEVIGITMYLYDVDDGTGGKTKPSFLKDATQVAEQLGIEHFIVDLRDLFDEKVRTYFESEYLNGRTPNPCIVCNKQIKYGKLIEIAHSYGAYYLATGHYANIEYDKDIQRYRIYRGKADTKDQTFILNALTQNQLKYMMLPLGMYKSKEEVREIALKNLNKIGSKKDSMGICFLPEGYKKYMAEKFPSQIRKGNFVNSEGAVIGTHSGISNYTIGQKRNLGVHFDPPKYVIKIDPQTNDILLGNDSETYVKGFMGNQANFTLYESLNEPLRAQVKVCQWGWFLQATVVPMRDEQVMVLFDQPERAVAPGQGATFYHENEMIGGAFIESVMR